MRNNNDFQLLVPYGSKRKDTAGEFHNYGRWMAVLLGIVLVFTVVMLATQPQADAAVRESQHQTEQYYSRVCSNLHLLSKEARDAEDLYDLTASTHVDPVEDDIHQSIAWDQMQLTREALEEAKTQYVHDVAWQASMGNPPPKEHTCL